MPSANYCTSLSQTERIRVNRCEGEVHITRDVLVGAKGFVMEEHIGPLTRAQAERVAQSILTALKEGY